MNKTISKIHNIIVLALIFIVTLSFSSFACMTIRKDSGGSIRVYDNYGNNIENCWYTDGNVNDICNNWWLTDSCGVVISGIKFCN